VVSIDTHWAAMRDGNLNNVMASIFRRKDLLRFSWFDIWGRKPQSFDEKAVQAVEETLYQRRPEGI